MPREKQFDWSRYPKKRIALMFLYLGWEYDGLVRQTTTENTVEEHLFAAMLKTRLIESAESCEFTRCGRTDKGVSAFKQVAAVTVRSTNVSDPFHFWTEESASPELRISSTSELPYVKMLNGVLPKTIRVIACAPVEQEFSARHNCVERAYTYIFPRALVKDIPAIQDACTRLVGEHDFRNFCHIDRNEGRLNMSYVRTITGASIQEMSQSPSTSSTHFDLFKLTIKASGFLWHQIRCIVSLLYEIGPQYKMANELPLCLFDCSFPDGALQWEFDEKVVCDVVGVLQRLWAEYQIKASNIKQMLDGLSGLVGNAQEECKGLDEFIRAGPATKNYVPMAKRPRCDGLLELREKSNLKKRREEEECEDFEK